MVDERGAGDGVQRLLPSHALLQRLAVWRKAGYVPLQGVGPAGVGTGRPGKGSRPLHSEGDDLFGWD
eukprot:327847-Rhodomonas_salina.1